MENKMDDDRVRILAHDAINQRLSDFTNQVCRPEHKRLEEDRKERGERIEKLDDALASLAKCMNGKFTKLYYFLLVLLGTIITTLIAVLLK